MSWSFKSKNDAFWAGTDLVVAFSWDCARGLGPGRCKEMLKEGGERDGGGTDGEDGKGRGAEWESQWLEDVGSRFGEVGGGG